MIIPAILIFLLLGGFAWLHLSGNENTPFKVVLLVAALACAAWYLTTAAGTKQPTNVKMETTKSVSIGYALAKQSRNQLTEGDEVLLLTTSFPAWKNMSEDMVSGAQQALNTQKGLTIREIDITTLEGGNVLQADGLALLRALAGQAEEIQGVDAIITAFPMMGENLNPRVLPKLPPLYGYYDGRSMNWLNLVNKKYFHGIAVPMIWREEPTEEKLNELETMFRQEYILATPENLDEFKSLR